MPVTKTANESVNVIVPAHIAILTEQVSVEELEQWGAAIFKVAQDSLSRRHTFSDYYLNLVHEGGKFILEIKTYDDDDLNDDERLTSNNIGKLTLHPIDFSGSVDDCRYFFKDEVGKTVSDIITAVSTPSHFLTAAYVAEGMIKVAYERLQAN